MAERPSQRLAHVVLAAILVVYLVLGGVYSVVVPVLEAPDESFHFFVVKHIVDYGSLPVQEAEARKLWMQEGSQPPLYYLTSALLVGGIDMSDAEALLWANPQANIGDPANLGNKNLYIHPSEQQFPWHGAVLAVHVLRFFSLALGTVTVFLIWAMTRLVFPARPVLALSVAATAAFIPQFLFVTASVNNDNLMTLLGTLAIYLLLCQLKAVRNTARIPYRWFLVGIVLGLACLAKLSALALLVLTGAVIGMAAWHRRSWTFLFRAGLAVGLPVLAIAGWWYVRNVVLYGEPTGLTAMWKIVGRRSDFGQDLWGEFRGLRWSFWGLFGWFSIAMPAWVYRVFDVLSLLAVVGLAIEVGRWGKLGLWRGTWASLRYREPEWGSAYRPLALALLMAWLGAVFVSLVRWTSLTEGTQGRLLFPATASFALFFVLGLQPWFALRVRDTASLVLSILLFALAVTAPCAWIAPAYAHPAQIAALPDGAIPTVDNYTALDIPFGEAILLRGVSFEQEKIRPGDVFRVGLYWQTDRLLEDEDMAIWLRLLDANGQVIGLEDAYPGAGTFPVSLWPAGPLLVDRQYVRVGDDTAAPLIARLDVELYRVGGGGRLSAGRDLPTIGRVKVVPHRWPAASKAAARFDAGGTKNIALSVASVPETMNIGEALSIILTWNVQTSPQKDYTVFVHLESETGQVMGYGDGIPRDGNYPTRYWAAREVIMDEHTLRANTDAPPGRYHLLVGLYNDAGRSVAYRQDGERWPNDAVDLGVVEVK